MCDTRWPEGNMLFSGFSPFDAQHVINKIVSSINNLKKINVISKSQISLFKCVNLFATRLKLMHLF